MRFYIKGKYNWRVLFFIYALGVSGHSQSIDDISVFQYGKIWPPEFLPLDYFNETYHLSLTSEWVDKVQHSMLVFSNFCSASFISTQGLILTNHNCSQVHIKNLERPGENLYKDGFYATRLSEERSVEGLFVDQLLKIADISDTLSLLEQEMSPQQAENHLIDLYSLKKDWKGLHLKIISYYNGEKKSLYGYRRYNDVRLVFLPENDLATFGGIEDNFTYPRYSLEFSLWRVYDDEGRPVNSENHYFTINPEGIQKNSPVFIVGHPKSTEMRFRSITQLIYYREVQLPAVITLFESRVADLKYRYEQSKDLSLLSAVLSLENSIKAYDMIRQGLYKEELMVKKRTAETMVRLMLKSKYPAGESPWEKIDHIYTILGSKRVFTLLLAPAAYRGHVTQLMHLMYDYSHKSISEEERKELSTSILSLLPLNVSKEAIYLQRLIDDYRKFSTAYMLNKTGEEILTHSFIVDSSKVKLWLNSQGQMYRRDELILLIDRMIEDYHDAVELRKQYSVELESYNEEIEANIYQAFGSQLLAPHATNSLRVSDGRITPYPFQGTTAPVFTTFFGLYDRYIGHSVDTIWTLPKKWLNPPQELLSTPLNFISTNDIANRNAGAIVLNAAGEAVGLLFDGNKESIESYFIYDEAKNRAINLHLGGMMACLQHIYHTDRIIQEINHSKNSP